MVRLSQFKVGYIFDKYIIGFDFYNGKIRRIFNSEDFNFTYSILIKKYQSYGLDIFNEYSNGCFSRVIIF